MKILKSVKERCKMKKVNIKIKITDPEVRAYKPSDLKWSITLSEEYLRDNPGSSPIELALEKLQAIVKLVDYKIEEPPDFTCDCREYEFQQLKEAFNLACRYINEHDGKADSWPLDACTEDCEEPGMLNCIKCIQKYFLQKVEGD